ncbi:MAG TPA: 2-oxo acid dehydrogenase subunit E2, partial [Actinomycetota bacterium]|nr:2-oxo acid dehydrogenase subunit E2 [Actinomycetota bacterium]
MTVGKQFGPNTWLVEELYRQYVTDPESVSEVWREFFEDYTPRSGDGRPQDREEPREEPLAPPAGPGPERPQPARPREPKPQAAPTAPRGAEPLTGVSKVIAERMTESVEVPTATSFRQVSAKLLEVNREILNNHLKRTGGGKVSFTHLIAFA